VSEGLGLLVGTLATWRAAHLLGREDGPGHALVHARRALGTSWAGELLDCVYCLSLWLAAPVALLLTREPAVWLLYWPALSAGAVLIQRALDRLDTTPSASESDHAVLRPGSRPASERDLPSVLRIDESAASTARRSGAA